MPIDLTAIVLGSIAVALAWPVPLLLARARWPQSAPGLALALWQSIALAGGISMIGSLLLAGVGPFGGTLTERLDTVAAHLFTGSLPRNVTLANIFSVSAAVLLATHLILNLALTSTKSRNQRRAHMELLAMLSSPLPNTPRTRIIDHPAPAAYCLPGMPSVTVLSEGMIDLLSPEQLEAVLAHERAHLRQKHHLLLDAFRSWRRSLPWFPIATRAEAAVGLLTEMLADDAAREVAGDDVLAQAIRLVDDTGSAGRILGAPKDSRTPQQRRSSLEAREQRLSSANHTARVSTRLLVILAIVTLTAGPIILILVS